MSSTDEIHVDVSRSEQSQPEACYDNPLFHEDDDRDYKGPGAHTRGGQGAPAGQDGHVATAKDYMHSLPPGPQPVPDISFGQNKRRRFLLKLFLVLLVIVVVAVVIGLIVHFTSDSDSSSRTSPPPVISLSRQLQGSLTIVDGPFSVYKEEYKDNTSSSFTLLLRSFQFKMDSIFKHSRFKDIYMRTDIMRVSSGSLVVLFIIRLREARPLLPKDVQEMTSLIQDGFQDSLIVLGENSVSLKPEIVAPMTTMTPPGQCEVVRLVECVNLTSYHYTAFPNVLGHSSQEMAGEAFNQVIQMMDEMCHGSVAAFLCGLLVPQCGPRSRPLPPCRSFCEEVYGRCNRSMALGASFPVNCAALPYPDDPDVCTPSPYTPGKCVPVRYELCQKEGINSTAFPNLIGSEAEEEVILTLKLIMGVQMATDCYNYSMLFGCAAYLPPCSGNRTLGFHNIPPCRSLCEAYRVRCEIFLDIFYHPWPKELDCERLPDSPDTSVCVGYEEAHRPPEIGECHRGTVSCDDHRCIPYHWRCDGYQDCQDNADEFPCATCLPHETLCSTSSTLCINTTNVCDGDDHCYQASDEAECVRVGEVNDSRILLVRNAVTDNWEEVCYKDWNRTMSLLTCKQLGYSEVLTETMEPPTAERQKAILASLAPGGHPDRLQSFLSKGHSSCPASDNFIVKLTCWKPVCGTRPARYESPLRVVGGDEVRPGTWPWLVSLHGGLDRKFFCGGSVITPDWILTAGHCVGGGARETGYWTLIAGHTRRQAYAVHRQIRKPRKLLVHPGYNHTTVDNDIALIQLDKPLLLDDYLRPVCLPRPNQEIDVGTRCYVAGWGKTSTMAPTYQQAVREVNLDVVTWESCQAAIERSPIQLPYKLTQNMFCAGGAAGHDACQGDSGGPFMCRMPNTTDQWYQAGIVSWGIECAMPNAPGIYTRLPLFVNWIKETIKNNTST